MTKIAGSESGSGSISQRHGSADSGSGSTPKCREVGITELRYEPGPLGGGECERTSKGKKGLRYFQRDRRVAVVGGGDCWELNLPCQRGGRGRSVGSDVSRVFRMDIRLGSGCAPTRPGRFYYPHHCGC
jgi:hypothetical protein